MFWKHFGTSLRQHFHRRSLSLKLNFGVSTIDFGIKTKKSLVAWKFSLSELNSHQNPGKTLSESLDRSRVSWDSFKKFQWCPMTSLRSIFENWSTHFLLNFQPFLTKILYNGTWTPKNRLRRTNFDFSSSILQIRPPNFLSDFPLILGHPTIALKCSESILGHRWDNIFIEDHFHSNSILGSQPLIFGIKPKKIAHSVKVFTSRAQ